MILISTLGIMTQEQIRIQLRAEQARRDVEQCRRAIALCDWVLSTTQNPKRRAWAQQEREYYAQRAKSSQGIAANPI